MNLERIRVLLVDDNAQSLDLLLQVFMGFRAKQIQACRSAEEARRLLTTEPFDLVVIDGEMPGEDGFSLTRRLRVELPELNATAPVILISSHTPLQKILRARDAGANIVVKKPVAPATLLSRIEWMARSNRDFVKTETYCGPDRRFKRGPLPPNVVERRAEALALTADADRALSQSDIDSLFG